MCIRDSYRSIVSYEQHVSSPGSWLDEWNRLIQGCQNQGIYVIWIFDHFESAVRQKALLQEGAFGILRGHAQRPHFAYITCTNTSLHILFEEAFSDYTISPTRRAEASDFFNTTLEHPLELFGNENDIDQIIAAQAETLQVSFSAAEIASIKRFGGRFPFYTVSYTHLDVYKRQSQSYLTFRLRPVLDNFSWLLDRS